MISRTVSPPRIRRLALTLLLLSLLLVSCSAVRAQDGGSVRPASEARLPGLEATSGPFWTPSAYVQRNGEVTVFGAIDRNAGDGAILGLGQRLELGVGASEWEREGTKISGSAKFNLLPEALIAPAISVGVVDAFSTSHLGEYVVVSKSVIPYFVEAVTGQQHLALKLHAGYGGGVYANRPFAGAEIWGNRGFGGLAEVSAGRASIGPRYYHNGVGVTVGLLEMKRVGGSVSYTIPLP